MKNQKFLYTDLPSRISTRRSLVERYGSVWNTRLDYKYSTKRSIYKLALDIVKANVGKLHDTAYSYFRKKSKYMHTYWDYAGAWKQAFKRLFYKGRIQTTFFVDDEGLIQKKVRHFKFTRNKKLSKHQYNKMLKDRKQIRKISTKEMEEILFFRKLLNHIKIVI